MTSEERERMAWLCQHIAEEKDPRIFDNLVQELNDLLEGKHERMHAEENRKAN